MKTKIFSSQLRFAILACCIAVAGCNDDEVTQKNTEWTGAVRPLGEAMGYATYFDIGYGGGTIQSASGDIVIEIPQGALEGDITIGLQAVTNTAPNGTGHSYRLTPHDVSFEKPVRITMMYGDSVSFVDGLAVAYQKEDGIWYWPGTFNHDRATRKITVETTHFSDWSIYESIKITPTHAVVEPAGKVELRLVTVLPEYVIEDDLLTSLVPEESVPLDEPESVDASYIEKWTLVGPGAVASAGNTATYQAPAAMSENNEAVVHAWIRLKSGQNLVLLSTIRMAVSEMILDGGPYSNVRAVAREIPIGVYDSQRGVTIIAFIAEVNSATPIGVQISIPGDSIGTFQWTEADCYVMTGDNNGGVVGTAQKVGGGVHPGYIQITTYDEAGGFIAGNFEGPFTFRMSDCSGCWKVGSVKGSFVARRYR